MTKNIFLTLIIFTMIMIYSFNCSLIKNNENPDSSGNGETGSPPAPEISITQDSVEYTSDEDIYDFLNCQENTIGNTATFTIKNTGNSDLSITKITLSDPLNYTLTTTDLSATVAASGNTSFKVTFNPKSTGSKEAAVTITNNDSDEGSFKLRITGEGTLTPVPPDITIKANNKEYPNNSEIPYYFGNAIYHSEAIETVFTIYNLGNEDLVINDILLSDETNFTIDFPELPCTIKGSNHKTFKILFNPQSLGLITGSIGIKNNDPDDEGNYTIQLQGNAISEDDIIVLISQTGAVLNLFENIQLSATINPDTLDQSIIWSSSNPSIAAVDNKGLVNSFSEGTVVITATSEAYPAKSAACAISISLEGELLEDGIAKNDTISKDEIKWYYFEAEKDAKYQITSNEYGSGKANTELTAYKSNKTDTYFSKLDLCYNNEITAAETGNIYLLVKGKTSGSISIKYDDLNKSNSFLSDIQLSSGTLTPAFSKETYHYTVSVNKSISSINMTAYTEVNGSAIELDTDIPDFTKTVILSGSPSQNFNLNSRMVEIELLVTSINGSNTKKYTILITRDTAFASSNITGSANCMTQDSAYLYTAGFEADAGKYWTERRWRVEKRNKSDGNLTGGFGTGGVIISDFGSSPFDMIKSVEIDDNYLYLAGSQKIGSDDYQWRIEKRDKISGDLITDFGTNGLLIVNFNPNDDDVDTLSDMGLDNDYLYLLGNQYIENDAWGHVCAMRIEKRNKTDGNLVLDFGTNGFVNTNYLTTLLNSKISYGIKYPRALTLDADFIYIIGNDYSADTDWRLEKRSKTTGSLAGSFGNKGFSVYNYNVAYCSNEIYDICIFNDLIYIAGYFTNRINSNKKDGKAPLFNKLTGDYFSTAFGGYYQEIFSFAKDADNIYVGMYWTNKGCYIEKIGSTLAISSKGIDGAKAMTIDDHYLYFTTNNWRYEKRDKLNGDVY